MNHQGNGGGPAGLQPGVWPHRQGRSHHAPVNIFRDGNEKTDTLGPRWRSWSVNGERWVTHCTRRVPRHRHAGQLSNCRRPGHGSGVHLKCRRDLPAPMAAHFPTLQLQSQESTTKRLPSTLQQASTEEVECWQTCTRRCAMAANFAVLSTARGGARKKDTVHNGPRTELQHQPPDMQRWHQCVS